MTLTLSASPQVDVDLAKQCADLPEEDEELRKKLWLKIARHVVQEEEDVQTAMACLASCPLLKIEDVLPFFPGAVLSVSQGELGSRTQQCFITGLGIMVMLCFYCASVHRVLQAPSSTPQPSAGSVHSFPTTAGSAW